MSTQVNPPTLGAQTLVSLAIITDLPVPKSGQPAVGSYVLMGCTRDISLDLPSEELHPISCGLNTTEWMVPGKTVAGKLDVKMLDFADVTAVDPVQTFNNQRTVAKLVTYDQEGAIARTIYAIDWQPKISINFPDGDGETMVTGTGEYQRIIVVGTT